MGDPFAPLTAKPATPAERLARRRAEAASHGGKTHRGKRGPDHPLQRFQHAAAVAAKKRKAGP